MSPPDTDIERQTRRHRPALTGIGTAGAVAALLLAGLLVYITMSADAPEGAETQIDGRTGAVTYAD
ncbi:MULTISPECIES: hypothetical protein [unclassified Mameliella]|uniref:hypothetical protein n=1 Tax=unclassified Mameliella TaxID=2630630 RepID=UPI00273F9520|nr:MULTISPECIES: hypothetical protein [unclassified Mameliella]